MVDISLHQQVLQAKKESGTRTLQLITKGVLVFSYLILTITLGRDLFFTHTTGSISYIFPLICILILHAALFLIKIGHYLIPGFTLVAICWLVSFIQFFFWGIDVVEALLMLTFVLILTGILTSNRVAGIVFQLTLYSYLLLSFLQGNNILSYNNSWRLKPFKVSDGIVYGVTLTIIFLIIYLYNQALENAFARSLQQEKILSEERENLDKKIAVKVKDIAEAQLSKVYQLNKFVVLGKLAAGLLHDLKGPLTSQLLDVNSVTFSQNKKLTRQESIDILNILRSIQISAEKMEQYVKIGQKQLMNKESLRHFSLNKEINMVILAINSHIEKSGIQLLTNLDHINIYGKQASFFRIVLNLLTNSIEALDNIKSRKAIIKIDLHQNEAKSKAELVIYDNGSGMNKQTINQAFEPLFSTKTTGSGIGLTLTRQAVEKDFNGNISISSMIDKGTTIKVILPLCS